MNVRRWGMMGVLALFALAAVFFRQQSPAAIMTLSGNTMGSYYFIKVVEREGKSLEHLRPVVEQALARINNSLSTWEEKSLISRFNSLPEATSPLPIDDDFATVFHTAQDIFRASFGAFNPALAPLIRLWGFDRGGNRAHWPQDAEISAALQHSDFGAVRFTPGSPATIQRTVPGIELNFSAIAKGYAVDVLAQIVTQAGYGDFMVDIGGEIAARGQNLERIPWQVGIEQPRQNNRSIQTIVALHDEAIATSGDYRNYRERDGKRLSHMINPRTGRPITHNVASFSVRATNAMLADGWATALLVIGESGLKRCEDLQLACLMIVRQEGEFITRTSPAWVH